MQILSFVVEIAYKNKIKIRHLLKMITLNWKLLISSPLRAIGLFSFELTNHCFQNDWLVLKSR